MADPFLRVTWEDLLSYEEVPEVFGHVHSVIRIALAFPRYFSLQDLVSCLWAPLYGPTKRKTQVQEGHLLFRVTDQIPAATRALLRVYPEGPSLEDWRNSWIVRSTNKNTGKCTIPLLRGVPWEMPSA